MFIFFYLIQNIMINRKKERKEIEDDFVKFQRYEKKNIQSYSMYIEEVFWKKIVKKRHCNVKNKPKIQKKKKTTN